MKPRTAHWERWSDALQHHHLLLILSPVTDESKTRKDFYIGLSEAKKVIPSTRFFFLSELVVVMVVVVCTCIQPSTPQRSTC